MVRGRKDFREKEPFDLGREGQVAVLKAELGTVGCLLYLL